ncbi:MAG: thiamine-phosphate pyrophosphorylase [Candidatus Firestonebacteria bacterium]
MKNKLKIYRVIDANINRAREGLRVVEDICRLFLDDECLSTKIKNIRHSLSKTFNKENLLKFRDSESDIGRNSLFDKKTKVKTIKEILIANLTRCQESMRVLEEFSKLVSPEVSSIYKKIRFKLYDVEKKIFKKFEK